MPFPVNLSDGVEMTVTGVNRAISSLDFSYQVTNETTHRIFIVNELFHRRGAAGFQVDPNLVYASLEPGPILQLSKRIVEIPEMMKVEAPETPYVTPLQTRKQFSETLQIPLPILPKDPYDPQEESEEAQIITSFYFTVGYVIEDKPLEVKPATLPDGSQHLRPWYSEVVGRQRLKRSGPHQADIPVLIHLASKNS